MTANNRRYILASNFGRIMTRKRFQIWRTCILFTWYSSSEQGNRTIAQRSKIQDFLKAIKNHRRSFVIPFEKKIFDETMPRWYGFWGSWSDIGLLHYVALDRTPENGREIQSVACGRSGIILGLEIATGRENHRPRYLRKKWDMEQQLCDALWILG